MNRLYVSGYFNFGNILFQQHQILMGTPITDSASDNAYQGCTTSGMGTACDPIIDVLLLARVPKIYADISSSLRQGGESFGKKLYVKLLLNVPCNF
jgi:hypothetical protein